MGYPLPPFGKASKQTNKQTNKQVSTTIIDMPYCSQIHMSGSICAKRLGIDTPRVVIKNPVVVKICQLVRKM